MTIERLLTRFTPRSNLLFSLLILLMFNGCVAPDSPRKTSGIPVIDTHIHFYDTDRPEGLPWPPESDTVLYRPILPTDFNKVADENGITATVIVEASEWLPDNQWVLDLVKHDPQRYIGLVGSLEIGTDDFEKNLKTLSKDQRYVGIRMRERPGEEAYFTEAVWRDLQILADMKLTLDVLMFQFSLDDVAMVAEKIPDLKILINHVAGADIDGNPVSGSWAEGVKRAASHSNVYCKISGLFQQSHRQPSPTDPTFYEPVLDELWKAFGEDRLIYGSNWPVTMRGGNYGDYKAVVLAYFEPLGQGVLEKLLYRNALKFYGLPPLNGSIR